MLIIVTSEDVLLWRDGVLVIASHHHLSVVDQVEGEDEGTNAPIDHLEILVIGNKYHHESEDDQAKEDTDKSSSHYREVPLGL